MPFRTSQIALIAAVLALTGVGGCGGDDDGNGEATDTNAEAALTETSPPVKYSFEKDTAGRIGGSEAKAAGWTGVSGASTSRDTSRAHSGKASLEVETAGSGREEAATINAPSIPVTPSTTYAASAWVRAPKGTKLDFRLNERDQADSSLGDETKSVTATGDWQLVTVTKDFGAEGERARVRVFSPEAITYHLDDVSLGGER